MIGWLLVLASPVIGWIIGRTFGRTLGARITREESDFVSALRLNGLRSFAAQLADERGLGPGERRVLEGIAVSLAKPPAGARGAVYTASAEFFGSPYLALEAAAEGLSEGQTNYGPIDPIADHRDWRTEAKHEIRDWFVYDQCEAERTEAKAQ